MPCPAPKHPTSFKKGYKCKAEREGDAFSSQKSAIIVACSYSSSSFPKKDESNLGCMCLS